MIPHPDKVAKGGEDAYFESKTYQKLNFSNKKVCLLSLMALEDGLIMELIQPSIRKHCADSIKSEYRLTD